MIQRPDGSTTKLRSRGEIRGAFILLGAELAIALALVVAMAAVALLVIWLV